MTRHNRPLSMALMLVAGGLLGLALLGSPGVGAAPAAQVPSSATPTPFPTYTATRPAPPAGATASKTPTRRPDRRAATSTPTVGPYTGTPSAPFVPIVYSSPAITTVQGIWLGELTKGANIRNGPGTTYGVNRNWPQGRRVLVYATLPATNGELWYQVSRYPDPTLYVHSSLVKQIAPLTVARPLQTAGRWVDVNLTQQTLIAYEGIQPVMIAQIASGKKGFETEVGVWPVYYRLPLQDMDGGGTGPKDPYYNLKDVPWIQYFHMSGQGLHGTYWHDLFGRPRSHGCVNLSVANANWLYIWGALKMPVRVQY